MEAAPLAAPTLSATLATPKQAKLRRRRRTTARTSSKRRVLAMLPFTKVVGEGFIKFDASNSGVAADGPLWRRPAQSSSSVGQHQRGTAAAQPHHKFSCAGCAASGTGGTLYGPVAQTFFCDVAPREGKSGSDRRGGKVGGWERSM